MSYLSRSLVDEISRYAFSQGVLEDLPSAQYPRKITSTLAINDLKQLLSAFAAVHQKDLIHRDIKPANVLLDSQGQVQLCDFSIAN